MPMLLNFISGDTCERRSVADRVRNRGQVVRPAMTIAEFQAALRARNRRVHRATLGATLALAALWALAWAVSGWLPPIGIELDGGRTAHWAVGVLVPLALTVVGVCGFGAWYSEREARRDPRLTCRQCRGPLDVLAPLVLATRSCPNCGIRVLNDETQ